MRKILLGAMASCLLACAVDAEETGVAGGELREPWNAANDPLALDPTFERDVKKLPTFGGLHMDGVDVTKEGASTFPSPSGYWPLMDDGINAHWDAAEPSASPVRRLARAEGLDAVALENAASAAFGLADPELSSRKTCREAADCAKGETCGKRAGKATGICVGTWEGLCHGWAPFAVYERHVRRAVTKNGVTLHAGDLEALMSAAYTRAPSAGIGRACRTEKPAKTADGRMVESPCRDVNPGAFFVALANRLGKQHRPVILDRETTEDVWNHPVVGYVDMDASWDDLSLRELSLEDARRRLGLHGPAYTPNAAAKRFFHMHIALISLNEVTPQRQSNGPGFLPKGLVDDLYEAVLEADAEGRIIGGEWIGASRDDHPDFLWWLEEDANGRPKLPADFLPGVPTAELRRLYDQASRP